MQAFASAPRTMVVLLAIVVVVLTVQVILFSPLLAGLLWPALIAGLSLSALFGSDRAARILKWVLYVLGAGSVLMIVLTRMSIFDITRTLFVGVLLFAVARYLGKSRAVASFYDSNSSPPTIGGDPA
jgi:hypothetical protein